MSRRQFSYSLSRRDVDFQRRDVNFNDPLERRDVNNQRRDVDSNEPLERRDVAPNVPTFLIKLSVTSRRCPERCDVV